MLGLGKALPLLGTWGCPGRPAETCCASVRWRAGLLVSINRAAAPSLLVLGKPFAPRQSPIERGTDSWALDLTLETRGQAAKLKQALQRGRAHQLGPRSPRIPASRGLTGLPCLSCWGSPDPQELPAPRLQAGGQELDTEMSVAGPLSWGALVQ